MCHTQQDIRKTKDEGYISFESEELIEGGDTSKEANTEINTKTEICTGSSWSLKRTKTFYDGSQPGFLSHTDLNLILNTTS